MKNAAWCCSPIYICGWRGEPEDLHERDGRKLCPRCGSVNVEMRLFTAPKDAITMSKSIPVIINETGEQISTSRDVEGRVQLEIRPHVINAHIDLRTLLAWAAFEHPDLMPTSWWRGDTPECMKLSRNIVIDPNGHRIDVDGQLSASEAVYGVLAWLTTVENPVVLSAHHNAGVAAIAADLFCKANGLQPPRATWNRILNHPKEEPEKPGRSITIEVGKPIRHREVVDNEMLAAKHIGGDTIVMHGQPIAIASAMTQLEREKNDIQRDRDELVLKVDRLERELGESKSSLPEALLRDALATYRGLLVGMRSPNWMRPSDTKLDAMLDVARRAEACIGPPSFADLGKSPAFQSLAQEATKTTLTDVFKSTTVASLLLGDPVPRTAKGDPDYTAMSAGEMVDALGGLADRWAKAFAQYAAQLRIRQPKLRLDGSGADFEPLDEGWLIGWFANAMQAAIDADRKRRHDRIRPIRKYLRARMTPERVSEDFAKLVPYEYGHPSSPNDRERALITAIVDAVEGSIVTLEGKLGELAEEH